MARIVARGAATDKSHRRDPIERPAGGDPAPPGRIPSSAATKWRFSWHVVEIQAALRQLTIRRKSRPSAPKLIQRRFAAGDMPRLGDLHARHVRQVGRSRTQELR